MTELAAYKGLRCLVTGHTGFKGAWLSLWLDRLGASVVGCSLDPPSTPNLFDLAKVAKRVEDIREDICRYERMAEIVNDAKPSVIFHLAAQTIVRTSYDRPKYTFDTNVAGTVNVLEAARACHSLKAIVVVTSDKCYENRAPDESGAAVAFREEDPLGGHDPYSASKAAAEMVCSAYRRSFFDPDGIGLATCRAGNVIGGGDWAADRIIPDAVRAINAGRAVQVRSPESVRPWQHVLEPLSGYLLLGARLLGNPVYSGAWNFGPDAGLCQAVRRLTETFLHAYGKGSWQDASSAQAHAPHEASSLLIDSRKAYRQLGWRPRWAFDETVRRTGAWYRKQAEGEDAFALCQQDIEDYRPHESADAPG